MCLLCAARLLDKHAVKAFLINLDRATLRLKNADAQLRRLGVEYERIPAVDGQKMTNAEFKASYSAFRWWCSVGWHVRVGLVACGLSHYAAYRKMIDDNLPFCCIFEDDVVVTDELPRVLGYVENTINPAKPEVVLLHDHTAAANSANVGDDKPHPPRLERSSGDCFAEGYVITRVAAERLLKVNMPLKIALDQWDRWVRLGLIDLYHARPAVCRQDASFDSTILPKGYDKVSDLPLPKLALHKAKRLIGRSIDWLLMFFERIYYRTHL